MEQARFETQGPNTVRDRPVHLEELRQVFKRLIAVPENVDLLEEVLAADVEPVATHETACGKSLMIFAPEVIEDVVEELGREVAYGNSLLLRGHGDRCQIDAL